MSTTAYFGQATHTLTIIGQQEPTEEHLRTLHNGYLADLMRAIRSGTIPRRDDFQKFLGLLPELKVWKTIKLGLSKSADEYRQAIKAKGNRISDWGNDILGKPDFKTATEEREVDLVVASNAELGYPDGATVKQTFDRAMELGLELCPNEVGPALRKQYQDQPMGEWILIAMEPITGSDGRLRVFYVGHGGYGRWLSADWAIPEIRWNLESELVFVRRK